MLQSSRAIHEVQLSYRVCPVASVARFFFLLQSFISQSLGSISTRPSHNATPLWRCAKAAPHCHIREASSFARNSSHARHCQCKRKSARRAASGPWADVADGVRIRWREKKGSRRDTPVERKKPAPSSAAATGALARRWGHAKPCARGCGRGLRGRSNHIASVRARAQCRHFADASPVCFCRKAVDAPMRKPMRLRSRQDSHTRSRAFPARSPDHPQAPTGAHWRRPREGSQAQHLEGALIIASARERTSTCTRGAPSAGRGWGMRNVAAKRERIWPTYGLAPINLQYAARGFLCTTISPPHIRPPQRRASFARSR